MATDGGNLTSLCFKHGVLEKVHRGTEPRVLGDAYSLQESTDIAIASQIIISNAVKEDFSHHENKTSKTFSLVVKA
jgi:hypothetical protein